MHSTQDGFAGRQVTNSNGFLDSLRPLRLTARPECETPPRPFDLRTRAISESRLAADRALAFGFQSVPPCRRGFFYCYRPVLLSAKTFYFFRSMSSVSVSKYRPFPPVVLPNRQWPNRT